jgi:hypothetical protein
VTAVSTPDTFFRNDLELLMRYLALGTLSTAPGKGWLFLCRRNNLRRDPLKEERPVRRRGPARQTLKFSGSGSGTIEAIFRPGAARDRNRHGFAFSGAPGVTTVLIPEHRNRTDLYRTAQTDQNGRFTITNITEFEQVVKMDLEGMVCKLKSSTLSRNREAVLVLD